jgi:hypothetical protein
MSEMKREGTEPPIDKELGELIALSRALAKQSSELARELRELDAKNRKTKERAIKAVKRCFGPSRPTRSIPLR